MQIFDTIMETVSVRVFGIEAAPRRSLQISIEDYDPAMQPFEDIISDSQRRSTSQILLSEVDITIDEQMAEIPTCSVCICDLKKTAVRLKCGHLFHDACAKEWLK